MECTGAVNNKKRTCSYVNMYASHVSTMQLGHMTRIGATIEVSIQVESLRHVPPKSTLQNSVDGVGPGPTVDMTDVLVLGPRSVFLPLLGFKQTYSSHCIGQSKDKNNLSQLAATSGQTNAEVAERLNELGDGFEESLAMFVHEGLRP